MSRQIADSDNRWTGITRPYSIDQVNKIRGSLKIQHTLAERGAKKLWNYFQTEPYVNALGALTGNQAMQQVRAGLKAIYLSGWQCAADVNLAGEMLCAVPHALVVDSLTLRRFEFDEAIN